MRSCGHAPEDCPERPKPAQQFERLFTETGDVGGRLRPSRRCEKAMEYNFGERIHRLFALSEIVTAVEIINNNN